jgi:hypothetical protein
LVRVLLAYAASDVSQIVRSYKGCQYFTRQVHTSAQELQTIHITWSFTVLSLDLLGPFKKAPGGLTHLLVVIDKFTKWIEVMHLGVVYGFKSFSEAPRLARKCGTHRSDNHVRAL